jgi:hypothetical protein
MTPVRSLGSARATYTEPERYPRRRAEPAMRQLPDVLGYLRGAR